MERIQTRLAQLLRRGKVNPRISLSVSLRVAEVVHLHPVDRHEVVLLAEQDMEVERTQRVGVRPEVQEVTEEAAAMATVIPLTLSPMARRARATEAMRVMQEMHNRQASMFSEQHQLWGWGL